MIAKATSILAARAAYQASLAEFLSQYITLQLRTRVRLSVVESGGDESPRWAALLVRPPARGPGVP